MGWWQQGNEVINIEGLKGLTDITLQGDSTGSNRLTPDLKHKICVAIPYVDEPQCMYVKSPHGKNEVWKYTVSEIIGGPGILAPYRKPTPAPQGSWRKLDGRMKFLDWYKHGNHEIPGLPPGVGPGSKAAIIERKMMMGVESSSE